MQFKPLYNYYFLKIFFLNKSQKYLKLELLEKIIINIKFEITIPIANLINTSINNTLTFIKEIKKYETNKTIKNVNIYPIVSLA